MNLMDIVLHAWDLAVATGQAYTLPEAAAEVVARAVEANAELFRQYQGFAAPVPGAGRRFGAGPALARLRPGPALGAEPRLPVS